MSAKISVGGNDRTDDLRTRLRDLPLPSDLAAPADALASAPDEEAYLDHLIRLLREQEAARTDAFPIPRKPGWIGGLLQRVRMVLWKGLRYQHDHMARQHNTIHAMQAAALEFERDSTRRKIHALEERLAALEERTRSTAP
jgi:hypothetical protein